VSEVRLSVVSSGSVLEQTDATSARQQNKINTDRNVLRTVRWIDWLVDSCTIRWSVMSVMAQLTLRPRAKVTVTIISKLLNDITFNDSERA